VANAWVTVIGAAIVAHTQTIFVAVGDHRLDRALDPKGSVTSVRPAQKSCRSAERRVVGVPAVVEAPTTLVPNSNPCGREYPELGGPIVVILPITGMRVVVIMNARILPLASKEKPIMLPDLSIAVTCVSVAWEASIKRYFPAASR